MSDQDDAMMSRRASAPDGKLTANLDLMVSQELLEALITLAHVKAFQNRSEYVRDVLHRHVFGELETVRLLARAMQKNPGNS
jgi:hypothetical protein